MAQSAMIQWAEFLPKMAIWLPAGRFSARRCAAMERTSFMISRQRYCFTRPAPMGCVKCTASGRVFSQ
jgi:hypothetical protein